MKPVREINQFAFKASRDSALSEFLPVCYDVTFQSKSKEPLIYGVGKELVEFPLFSKGEKVEHFRFEEGAFTKTELVEYSRLFDFGVVPHRNKPGVLVGSLDPEHENYTAPCCGALSGAGDKNYLLVYAKRKTKHAKSNIVYIHGIWEVKT